MAVNSIVYKLNSENLKEFSVHNSSEVNTIFVIRDFYNIDASELSRLLRKNRKILISDHSIIDINKLLSLKHSLKDQPELFNNLLISKECYLKSWFHSEYYDVLKELEISNMIDVEDVIRSETLLKTTIKLKFFDSPSYLIKVLDSSLFVKKMSLESFEIFKYDLVNEFNSLVSFYNEIKNNLIPSVSIYIEQISKETNTVINVVDNLVYEDLVNIDANKVGIAHAVDISNTTVAAMDIYEKHIIRFPQTINVGWIDAVELKHKIRKMNIDTLYLNGLEMYDNLDEIKVCSEYGFNNIRTKSIQDIDENDSIVPLYTKFDGWRTETFDIENPDEIPHQMLYLISEIKKMVDVKEIIVLLANLEIRF